MAALSVYIFVSLAGRSHFDLETMLGREARVSHDPAAAPASAGASAWQSCWALFWRWNVGLSVPVGIVATVWFLIGGARDFRQLLLDLRSDRSNL